LAPGVTITATSKALLHPRTTVTGAGGSYWIGALPPGEYEIVFARTGVKTLTRRAVVELARVARADGALEASEEEESVTSTAKTISVAETTAITTHFSDQALDRLPVRRDPASVAGVVPFGGPGEPAIVDDAVAFAPHLFGQEIFEQITFLRGALPVEYEHTAGVVAVARTRSGGEALAGSMRDTLTSEGWIGGAAPAGTTNDGVEHLAEAAVGGRIVRDRLWFFGAGWAGDIADQGVRDLRGVDFKLTSQLGASQSLVAQYVDADSDAASTFASAAGELALHYTAVPDALTTVEVLGNRSTGTLNDGTIKEDRLLAKASHLFSSRRSDHLLAAGFSSTGGNGDSSHTFFASDRWSVARLTLNLGARYENGDTERITPRIAATYDLLGDGTRAAIASYSEYTDPRFAATAVKEAAVGYASAIGASGLARVDAIRRDFGAFTVNTLQLDASYRLFDRFEAGANYAWSDLGEKSGDAIPSRIANGWISAELPIGTHTFGATLLQRHISGGAHEWPTDLGLRYSIPFSGIGLTVAADGTDVLASERGLRIWIRARL
jgi:carboxypeptidase family protein